MLYEIDAFGFVGGYIRENWTVMSELDLLEDKKLRRELERVKYEDWKKHNIAELKERWENHGCKHYDDFEKFCKKTFNNIGD